MPGTAWLAPRAPPPPWIEVRRGVRCCLALLLAGLWALPAAAQSSPAVRETSSPRRENAGVKAPRPRLKTEALAAPGFGIQPAPQTLPGLALGPAPPSAVPPPLSLARPAVEPAVGVAPVPPPRTHGAFYLAVAPRTNFGMVVGQQDRLSAHRQAEIACRATGGNCVLVQDFTEPCIVVAEGVRRATGVMFMTSDATTYRVIVVTHGLASNPADAERQAIRACMARDSQLTCRPVQAACGPR